MKKIEPHETERRTTDTHRFFLPHPAAAQNGAEKQGDELPTAEAVRWSIQIPPRYDQM